MTSATNQRLLKRLQDITSKIGSGATPRGGKNSYRTDGISLIRSLNVYDFEFVEEDLAFIDDDQAAQLDNVVVEKDDILLNITGASVARCCLVNPKFLPARVNQHVAIVRVRPELADARFVLYCINSPLFKRHLLTLAQGGATREALTKTTIEDFEVLQPPLPIQRRIAGILAAYDELIENSQRRIRLLETMARSLYREWFVHFRFPGHADHPRVASALGEIPAGWEGIFGDIAAIDRSSINPSDFPDERFEHFSIPAFDDGCTPAVELGKTILSNKYCIDDSCVLLSKLNPRIPRIWLPAPSGMMRAVTSTEFLTLKPKPGFTREFIYAKCCADEFVGQFASLAIGTSTSHQRVKPENLLSMPSTVPDRKVVEQFTKLVAPMLVISEKLRTKIQNLRQTRDLLLPRLLAGQVELEEVA